MRQPPNVSNGSLADVGFLLLIFFLITANLQEDYVVRTKIAPLNGERDSIQPILMNVLLNANGNLLVNGTQLTMQQYKVQLENTFPEGPIKLNFYAHPQVQFIHYLKLQDASLRWHRMFTDSLISVENLAENWVRTNYTMTISEEMDSPHH